MGVTDRLMKDIVASFQVKTVVMVTIVMVTLIGSR